MLTGFDEKIVIQMSTSNLRNLPHYLHKIPSPFPSPSIQCEARFERNRFLEIIGNHYATLYHFIDSISGCSAEKDVIPQRRRDEALRLSL